MKWFEVRWVGERDAAKKDTLAKDAALGNLFSGTLSNTAPLMQPTGEFKLYFDSANISDLWLAVSWSSQP